MKYIFLSSVLLAALVVKALPQSDDEKHVGRNLNTTPAGCTCILPDFHPQSRTEQHTYGTYSCNSCSERCCHLQIGTDQYVLCLRGGKWRWHLQWFYLYQRTNGRLFVVCTLRSTDGLNNPNAELVACIVARAIRPRISAA